MLQLKTTCACNVSVPRFSQNLSLKKNKNYDYACIHYEVNHAQVLSPKSEVRSPKSLLGFRNTDSCLYTKSQQLKAKYAKYFLHDFFPSYFLNLFSNMERA